jgi:excisionase family DNA binding protein
MTKLNMPLLSPREVAELFGVSTGTLRSWRERGDGPAFLKVGKLVKYEKTDLEVWLAATNEHRDDLGG